jgi:NarL family two-component system response regulator LiaR
VKAGALGYLLKDSSPVQLLEAIRQVHRGEPSLEPGIARKVLQELSSPGQGKPTADPLTQRELEVLRLISQGLSNKEIAAKIFVAEWTVRSHVSNVLSKLHLASRTQAALYALRSGLASIDDIPLPGSR